MHLTNFAINKHNSKFKSSKPKAGEQEDRSSHKRSIQDFFDQLETEQKIDTGKIWKGIQILVVKTICSIQPTLRQAYKA